MRNLTLLISGLFAISGFWFVACDELDADGWPLEEPEPPAPTQQGFLGRIGRRRNGRRRFGNVTKRLNFLKVVNNLENENYYRTAIRLRFFKFGDEVYESAIKEPNVLAASGCSPNDKFAFIFHGWRQSCDTEWVYKLIERLTYHRGGCIVCVDYGALAESSYLSLYRIFKPISNVISEKILNLIDEGVDPAQSYMFGFSYGGQLAAAIGRALGRHRFKTIDTCDMAGPGFDLVPVVDHRDAATFVQCLHSSRDKGTHVYACHQNVRLGNCGYNQPATASQPYYSSHGLCVQMYINAFDYPFYALTATPPRCISRNPALNIPDRFTIGYNENPNAAVQGEIFVPTSLNYPYNMSEKELFSLGLLRTRRHTDKARS